MPNSGRTPTRPASIVVDSQCRTSDARIFAAGDVTRFAAGYVTAQPQGMVRLENWLHAQEQGGVAGRNAAGGNESYAAVPSFWSEQYDLYIQGVGWSDQAAKRVRRSLPGKGTFLLETKAGKITYALGINAQRDLAQRYAAHSSLRCQPGPHHSPVALALRLQGEGAAGGQGN